MHCSADSMLRGNSQFGSEGTSLSCCFVPVQISGAASIHLRAKKGKISNPLSTKWPTAYPFGRLNRWHRLGALPWLNRYWAQFTSTFSSPLILQNGWSKGSTNFDMASFGGAGPPLEVDIAGSPGQGLLPNWLWQPGCANLELMGVALRSRGIWSQRTAEDKPWQGLSIPSWQKELSFVAASISCQVGNGDLIWFWEDRWLDGSRIRSLALALYDCVPVRVWCRRTVVEGLLNRRWIHDIQGALRTQAILDRIC
jgi:hypothetical protein